MNSIDQILFHVYAIPPDLTENSINDVKENDIIFVKTDYLKSNYFQTEVLPRIKVPFKLVSGISSYTVDNYQPIIDNELCEMVLHQSTCRS